MARHDTSALTGFRSFISLFIFLEHAGLHSVSGAGAFFVLSGAVLSTSRSPSLGLVRYPIESLSEYLEFQFMRLSRIFPAYWFHLFFVYTNAQLFGNPYGAGWNFKQILGQALPNGLDYPASNYWFVLTVVQVYMFYPILERLILGPQMLRPASPKRFQCLFLVCCAIKLFQGYMMLKGKSKFAGGALRSWYIYRGRSLYANPLLRLPEFVLGMLVPHLSSPQATNCFARWLPVFTDVLGCSMVILAVMLPQSEESYMLCNFNVEAPLTALVLWGLCYGQQNSRLGELFATPELVRVGKTAYGVYLYSFFFLVKLDAFEYMDGGGKQVWWPGLRDKDHNHWWKVFEAYCCTLFMAACSSALVEEPVAKKLRSLLDKVRAFRQRLQSMEVDNLKHETVDNVGYEGEEEEEDSSTGSASSDPETADSSSSNSAALSEIALLKRTVDLPAL